MIPVLIFFHLHCAIINKHFISYICIFCFCRIWRCMDASYQIVVEFGDYCHSCNQDYCNIMNVFELIIFRLWLIGWTIIGTFWYFINDLSCLENDTNAFMTTISWLIICYLILIFYIYRLLKMFLNFCKYNEPLFSNPLLMTQMQIARMNAINEIRRNQQNNVSNQLRQRQRRREIRNRSLNPNDINNNNNNNNSNSNNIDIFQNRPNFPIPNPLSKEKIGKLSLIDISTVWCIFCLFFSLLMCSIQSYNFYRL